jgi:hypothetical protein
MILGQRWLRRIRKTAKTLVGIFCVPAEIAVV